MSKLWRTFGIPECPSIRSVPGTWVTVLVESLLREKQGYVGLGCMYPRIRYLRLG